MVFLIQNTQNRDSEAIQVKLDELLRVNGDAHNALLDLEELEEEELDRIRLKYEKLAERAREELRKGSSRQGQAGSVNILKKANLFVHQAISPELHIMLASVTSNQLQVYLSVFVVGNMGARLLPRCVM